MLIWMRIYDDELELQTVPRDLVWYKSTNNYNVIICLYVYDLFIYGNYMKKVYMIVWSVDIVIVIKIEKIWGLIFMSHYVEKMLLKFNHLKFNGAYQDIKKFNAMNYTIPYKAFVICKVSIES